MVTKGAEVTKARESGVVKSGTEVTREWYRATDGAVGTREGEVRRPLGVEGISER